MHDHPTPPGHTPGPADSLQAKIARLVEHRGPRYADMVVALVDYLVAGGDVDRFAAQWPVRRIRTDQDAIDATRWLRAEVERLEGSGAEEVDVDE